MNWRVRLYLLFSLFPLWLLYTITYSDVGKSNLMTPINSINVEKSLWFGVWGVVFVLISIWVVYTVYKGELEPE